jgi:hypothetical protein
VNNRPAWRIASVVIVAIVWAGMLAGALGLVIAYGTRTLPQNDELWALYDAGPGIQVQWLWKTWAEHRIPLAKLIWKGVLEVTAYDFRAGDFLTVLLLAGTAAVLIWTAGQIRSRVILADAFFPLALLNFGQAQVFLFWWQINHVLAPVTASALLALLILRGNHLQLRHAGLIGAGLILFVLCGPGGLPYVIALGFWLFVWAASYWSSFDGSQRRQCLVVLAAAMVALGLLAFYFVDYKPYFPVNDPPTVSSWAPSPGLLASAIAYLEMLGLSVGTATKPYAVASGVAVLIFALLTGTILIWIWFKRPSERWRVFGIAALLAAQTVTLSFIAWARAGMGLDYLYFGHYLTVAAPGLCCLYFVWEIRGGRIGRAIQVGMTAVLAALLPINFHQAVLVGQDVQQKTFAFERDVRSGVPASVLAEHHFASDVVPRAGKLTEILRAHKANRIGIFRQIRDDPEYGIHSLPLESAVRDGIAVREGIASALTDSAGTSSLTFAIPEPTRVYAVRLRYVYVKTTNAYPALRVYWRNSAVEDFTDKVPLPAARMFASTVSGPDQPTWALINGKIHIDAKVRTDRALTVWIDAVIDQIRIYPEFGPFDFRLSAIELLCECRG